MSEPVDWDARTYHEVAAPQEEWGREVLARLELRGDETVLDAGCGSGRVTGAALRAAPRRPGDRRRRLAGDDRARAREPRRVRRPSRAARLRPARARARLAGRRDLLQRHLPLDPRPRAAVRPPVRRAAARRGDRGPVRRQGQHRRVAARARVAAGGRAVRRLPQRHARRPGTYASVGDTRDRLERAGFEVAPRGVWLERRTVEPPDPRAFARSVGLSKHLALPARRTCTRSSSTRCSARWRARSCSSTCA